MSRRLRFRPDGTFTILQVTDTHVDDGRGEDERTLALIGRLLDQEGPDLVLFTGDVIERRRGQDPAGAYRQAVAPVEARQIPWAAVFGNHDDEHSLSRQRLLAVQQEHAHCLSQPGPPHLSGIGNYTLELYGAAQNRVRAVLYLLDSGSYAPSTVGGYGWIQPDQITWYRQSARTHRAANGGQPLPALAFFHIPLPEYNQVWETGTCVGHKHEAVCCPRYNSGFFRALVEMGDVMATFVGHDHVNDYRGELEGVTLCYGRATGYNTYGREDFQRGARLIRLYEGERRFDTWVRQADGTLSA